MILPSPVPFALTQPLPSGTSNKKALHWTLADVQRLALQNNPDIQAARANYAAAQKAVGVSISAYLPHVTVSAQFTETTLPDPSALSNQFIGTSEPYSFVAAQLNQLLFDFGKTLSRIDSSSSLSHAAEQDAVAVRNDIDLAVERAFYDVAASDKLVDVAQKGVEQFSETRRRAEVLVKTGTRPEFDLTQAVVQLGEAKLQLIKAENARDIAKVALLNLLGMPEQVPFELVDTMEKSTLSSQNLDLGTLTDLALVNRPEMKSANATAESARYDVQAEVRDYLPSIGLQAWYADYLPEYPAELRDSWGIGVGATWEIFSGLRTTFRASELSAKLDQRVAQVSKERADVAADVAASYTNLVKAESNLQVAEETIEFARENLRYAKARYNAAIATILELLVAETSYVNAEATLVQARYTHSTAIAALEKAVNAPLAQAIEKH